MLLSTNSIGNTHLNHPLGARTLFWKDIQYQHVRTLELSEPLNLSGLLEYIMHIEKSRVLTIAAAIVAAASPRIFGVTKVSLLGSNLLCTMYASACCSRVGHVAVQRFTILTKAHRLSTTTASLKARSRPLASSTCRIATKHLSLSLMEIFPVRGALSNSIGIHGDSLRFDPNSRESRKQPIQALLLMSSADVVWFKLLARSAELLCVPKTP